MIYKQLRSPLKLARSFPIELWDFIARVDNQTIDPYLPDQENKSFILEGLNLFSDGKLVGSVSADNPQTLKRIKRAMENQLEKETMAVVKGLQALDSDPVGFRKYMDIAGIKNWRGAYRSIPVAVKVKFNFLNLPKAH